MSPDQAVDTMRDAVVIALLISSPLLLSSVVVSLLTSLAQALTSIQDQTIGLDPKMQVVILMFLLLLPWILGQLMEYSQSLFRAMGTG